MSDHFISNGAATNRGDLDAPEIQRTILSRPAEIRPLLPRQSGNDFLHRPSSPSATTDYNSMTRTEVLISVEPENEVEPDGSLTRHLTESDLCPALYPQERLKTLVAFVFMSGCMFCTTLALSIVHDRVPSTPPLPDVVFDWVPQWDLGLSISEFLLVAAVWIAIFLVIFHRHRWIIFRRLFVIIGLLYFGRSVTMLVTALPVANTDYYCSPKMNHTSALVILERIGKLISGLGLSVNGQHTFCGDYIYSGHTCMLVLSALVVTEYAPRKLIPIMVLVYLLAVTGIVMVSISRGHYTVDIILAYYITTRIFWMYHSMVANAELKDFGPKNYLTNVCWFRLMRFCEMNVMVGKLPKHYTWPLPFPKKWQACRWEYHN